MKTICREIFKKAFRIVLVKKLFCMMSFFCFCLSAFVAEDAELMEKLSSIVGEELAAELVKSSNLLYMNYDGVEDGKPFQFNSSLLSRTQKNLPLKNPIFTMETLSLVKPSQASKNKKLSNILCSVSSLKGLQYYSPSRKKMRLLYKDSYVVKKIETKGRITYSRLEDPIDKVFDGLSLLVFQEDLTFGKNIYEFKYFLDDSGVSVIVSNTEPIYYSIFKALEAKDLNSMLVAYNVGDYLLLYTATRAKFKKIIGLETKVKNSFMARLDAMGKWFIAKYNE